MIYQVQAISGNVWCVRAGVCGFSQMSDVRGFTLLCAGMRGCAQMCEDVHQCGCALMCTLICIRLSRINKILSVIYLHLEISKLDLQ